MQKIIAVTALIMIATPTFAGDGDFQMDNVMTFHSQPAPPRPDDGYYTQPHSTYTPGDYGPHIYRQTDPYNGDSRNVYMQRID